MNRESVLKALFLFILPLICIEVGSEVCCKYNSREIHFFKLKSDPKLFLHLCRTTLPIIKYESEKNT